MTLFDIGYVCINGILPIILVVILGGLALSVVAWVIGLFKDIFSKE